jgi:hypothetical protein
MVFASVEDAAPPTPTDTSVTYFAAGVHAITNGGVLTLQNDSTVYLAPGAVVLGRIEGNNLRNVTVAGNGILAGDWLPGEAPPEGVCGHCGCTV